MTNDNSVDDFLNLTKKINSKIEHNIVGTKRFYSNNNSPFVDLVKSTGIEIV